MIKYYNGEGCARQNDKRKIQMQKNDPGPLPSVMALAYLGDARHSLYIRHMLVLRGLCKSGDLNSAALGYVTAEAQAAAARRIENAFTDRERDVFRRAQNSKHLNRPRHSSAADYRSATGFEAVIGMLYFLGDEERIERLLSLSYDEEKTVIGDIKNDTED